MAAQRKVGIVHAHASKEGHELELVATAVRLIEYAQSDGTRAWLRDGGACAP